MSDNKIAEVLNDLVQINNDRIAGYEVALSGLDEAMAYAFLEIHQHITTNVLQRIK